jgi:hypothetical protein
MQAVDAKDPPLRLPLDGTAVEAMRAKAQVLHAEADAWAEAASQTRL